MASKKVKKALPEQEKMEMNQKNVGKVRPALGPIKYEKPKKSRKAVRKALPGR